MVVRRQESRGEHALQRGQRRLLGRELGDERRDLVGRNLGRR
jgi:hypothetical protein